MSSDLEKLHAYYREGDNQYRMAGGEEGCLKLANDFYDLMETLPETAHIQSLHIEDMQITRRKLGLFLCGYFSGPNRYNEEFGPIKLGPAHAHIPIGTADKEAWLLCMKKALDLQPYPQEFKEFLLQRFEVPAERCRNRP
ncbi:MAG: group II truncated hemoglobin [Pontiellaceae bacterium]|nr:group II truncated hemoglobin [Pontiellaceae bacterium]